MNNHEILYAIENLNFIAIDIELANECRDSICSIGMVRVENGNIVDAYSTLVRPKELRFTKINSGIHGIHEDTVKDLPEIIEIWDDFSNALESNLLLAHNADFDISCLKLTANAYGLPHNQFKYMCTHKLACNSFNDLCDYRLNDVAEYLGIEHNHHNSLSDATVSAHIGILSIPLYPVGSFLHEHSDDLTYYFQKISSTNKKSRTVEAMFEKKKLSSNILKQELESVENRETPFFDKKVVFTGDLIHLSRSAAAEMLKKLGADINTSISKHTNIVVVGQKPGPSKMKKIEALNISGANITLMNEDDLLQIINPL
jgi:DNA polymerase III subunit epsilon